MVQTSKYQTHLNSQFRWYKQHETCEKLNVQAHKNAMNQTDEFVMDTLVTYDKIKTVVYDLLVTEVWKDKVLPHLVDRLAEGNSVRSYMAVSTDSRHVWRKVKYEFQKVLIFRCLIDVPRSIHDQPR